MSKTWTVAGSPAVPGPGTPGPPRPPGPAAPAAVTGAPGWSAPVTVTTGVVADSTGTKLRSRPFALALIVLSGLSFVAWLISKSDPQLALGAALLALILIDAYSARRAVSRLTIRMHGPLDALAGQSLDWVIGVDGFRRPVTLALAWTPKPRPILISTDRPGIIHLPASARGVIHRVVMDATATGPLGLFESGRRFRVRPAAPVYVGPQSSPFEIRWPTPKAVGFGFTESTPVGDEMFRSIRPYIRGDERRRIHWKSTARHGQLMVRECDGTGEVALQVIVDLGMPGPHAETVAAAAAFVAEEAIRKGWLVQLVTLDGGGLEPPITELGSAFGPPPKPAAQAPMRLQTACQRVGTSSLVRRQLATAAFGTPVPPRWSGLVCQVDPSGVSWR